VYFPASKSLLSLNLRGFPAIFAGVLLAAQIVPASAQENGGGEPNPIRLEALPAKFEIWRDEPGFTWQLNRQGALQSGEIPYFQGALALFVSGAPFAPTEAVRYDGGQVNEEGARIVLSQSGERTIVRDVWFDARRGGVRVIDTVTNNSKRAETVRVDLKSSFQSPWQDLHGTEGRILGTKPGAGLGTRDFGAVVKFSQSEGRHDTLFVTSAEKEASRPMISFSSNRRELTFSYDLKLEPGKSASLVHWIVQRNLQSAGDAEKALQPFYQRRQLVNPRVAAALIPLVQNFDEQSFPAEGVTPFDLDALVSLNRVIEGMGIHRRGEDILWITRENQLAGTVNADATLAVETAFGVREAGIGEVAAIQGGAGIGRTPRVFLRDGRVWAGPVMAENLTIKIAEGWDVEELKPTEISLLLMRNGNADGRPPEGADLFVTTRSGDVLAVVAGNDAPGLPVLSPWGRDVVSLGDLRYLTYTNGAAPRFRLRRADGSHLTVLLETINLELSLASGAKQLLPSGSIASAWKTGERLPSGDWLTDEWFDFEDTGLPENEIPRPACLLLGNNLLQGELKMEALNLVSGSAVTPLNPEEIIAIQRSPDSESGLSPLFEIGMAGGEVLTGRLRERVLFVESQGRLWRVPVQHFVAFRGKEE